METKEKIEYEILELTSELYPKTTGLFETLSHLTEAPEPSEEVTCEAIDAMSKEGSKTFVAVTPENEVIGTCKIMIEQKLIHGAGKVGHIEDVATRKGFEGNGIQTTLLRRAVEYAREKKCYKIILDCDDKNVGFYERLGFGVKDKCMRLNI